MLGNYIEDTNTWGLPKPPEWFLKRLFDFDAQLVLVPSRFKLKDETPKYLLCRRRQRTAQSAAVVMLDNQHPDTNLCLSYGLLPIAPLRFNKNVNQFTEAACESLLAELKRRDTWTDTRGEYERGDALVDSIEYEEELEKRKQRAQLKDMFYHRARDAWRSLTARAGWRNKRASDYHGTARPSLPPTKQRVILTDAS